MDVLDGDLEDVVGTNLNELVGLLHEPPGDEVALSLGEGVPVVEVLGDFEW